MSLTRQKKTLKTFFEVSGFIFCEGNKISISVPRKLHQMQQQQQQQKQQQQQQHCIKNNNSIAKSVKTMPLVDPKTFKLFC